MKRLIPSTLVGQLILAAVLTAVIYAVLVHFFFYLLVPTQWGGATQ